MQDSDSVRLRFTPFAACMLAAFGFVFSGCGTDSETNPPVQPEPTVRFDSPKMNETVAGPDVFVKVTTTHFGYSSAAAAKRSAGDVVGHIHLFLDMPAGVDADAVEQLYKADTVTLKGLTAGKHYLIAVGADAVHDDFESMVDSVAFTVTLNP
jgi:hypothetical protein